MKYLLLITAILSINLTQNYSQLKEGNNLAELTVGYSPKSQNVIFGLNYEHELIPSGIGVFGIGAVARYWTHSEDILENSGRLRNTNIAFGGEVNYNFNGISDGKFIPFAGIIAGYNNVNTKYTYLAGSSDNGNNTGTFKSGLFLSAQGGFRYFLSSKIAGAIRLGLGNFNLSAVELGADIKF